MGLKKQPKDTAVALMSFRLPLELATALKIKAAVTGKSMTQLIIEALQKDLSDDSSTTATK